MQVEKNAAAGRTPSSLPLSTPPPIAAIPSPKFAPSPVHTKSIDSKTDYNEDNASGETLPFRGQGDATDQQTDRYQTSGPPILHCLNAVACIIIYAINVYVI